jgi:CRISPR-associated endoribonuclease Cas6
MRLRITFHTERLPIIYRHRFMALIKEALAISSLEYKSFLYPEKDSEISKRTKPFSFAVLLPKDKKITRGKIKIDEDYEIEDVIFEIPNESKLSFVVSSPDYFFIIGLYNGLLKIKEFPIDSETNIKLYGKQIMREKEITENEVIFRTLSPILIEDKNEKPVLPWDEKFYECFNETQSRILKDIRGYGLRSDVIIEPIKIRKSVIKHYIRWFRKETGKPYMVLTCFEGIFKMKGEVDDLRDLYVSGVGLRTGQGFGLIEPVGNGYGKE